MQNSQAGEFLKERFTNFHFVAAKENTVTRFCPVNERKPTENATCNLTQSLNNAKF